VLGHASADRFGVFVGSNCRRTDAHDVGHDRARCCAGEPVCSGHSDDHVGFADDDGPISAGECVYSVGDGLRER
jgi:hypothetical protein